MSRVIFALLIVAGLAACGGGGSVAVSDMDDACAIVTAKPSYKRAFRAAERRWGVPVHVQMATIYHESRFRARARTPLRFALGVIPMGRQSSAYGYAQALDGTWDEYRDETGRRGARRHNIRDAADFIGWYMDKSHEVLGISKSDMRNQYLAYHEGRGGYARRSYRAKSWLVRIADQAARRAVVYESQLASCRRF